MVVITPPAFELFASILQIEEHFYVQTFVS